MAGGRINVACGSDSMKSSGEKVINNAKRWLYSGNTDYPADIQYVHQIKNK